MKRDKIVIYKNSIQYKITHIIATTLVILLGLALITGLVRFIMWAVEGMFGI